MDPYTLFVYALLLFCVGSILLVGFIFFRMLFGRESRASVFKKLAREYGLMLRKETYPGSLLLLPDELYRERTLEGSIAGRKVVVEDMFLPWYYKPLLPLPLPHAQFMALYYTLLYTPIGPYVSKEYTTRIWIDGELHQLNPQNASEEVLPGVPSVDPIQQHPLPASYKQIREALEAVKAGREL